MLRTTYSVSTWNKICVQWKTFQDFSTPKRSARCCKIYYFKNSLRKNISEHGSGIKSHLVFQKKLWFWNQRSFSVSKKNYNSFSWKKVWTINSCELLNRPLILSCYSNFSSVQSVPIHFSMRAWNSFNLMYLCRIFPSTCTDFGTNIAKYLFFWD